MWCCRMAEVGKKRRELWEVDVFKEHINGACSGAWRDTLAYLLRLATVNTRVPRQDAHSACLESLMHMLEGTPAGDSIILLGDFTTDVGSDCVTKKGVIGRNSCFDMNLSGVLLLGFCSHKFFGIFLSITEAEFIRTVKKLLGGNFS